MNSQGSHVNDTGNRAKRLITLEGSSPHGKYYGRQSQALPNIVPLPLRDGCQKETRVHTDPFSWLCSILMAHALFHGLRLLRDFWEISYFSNILAFA